MGGVCIRLGCVGGVKLFTCLNFDPSALISMVACGVYMSCVQFNSFNPELVQSTPQVRSDLLTRKMDKALLTDFFGSVRNIELLNISSQVPVKEDQYKREMTPEEEEEGHDQRGVAERSSRVLDVATRIGWTNVVSTCAEYIW